MLPWITAWVTAGAGIALVFLVGLGAWKSNPSAGVFIGLVLLAPALTLCGVKWRSWGIQFGSVSDQSNKRGKKK